MLCKECRKNQANVHMIREINGRRTEEHLCDECAKRLGRLGGEENMFGFFGMSPMRKMFSLMSGSGFDDAARDFFGFLPEAAKEQDEIAKRRALISEAISEERYEDAAVLRDEIKKLREEQDKIDEIKEKLRAAISEERYEDAAVLRDQIKALTEVNTEKKPQEKNKE